jgi:hypothetical protein
MTSDLIGISLLVLFSFTAHSQRKNNVYWADRPVDSVKGARRLPEYFPYVYFEPNSAKVSSAYKDSLRQLASMSVINSRIQPICITGYYSNDEKAMVGLKRALAVQKILNELGFVSTVKVNGEHVLNRPFDVWLDGQHHPFGLGYSIGPIVTWDIDPLQRKLEMMLLQMVTLSN